MVDYRKSLKIGIEASKQAKRNLEEIESVLAEANAEIGEVTDGLVKLLVRRQTYLSSAASAALAFAIDGVGDTRQGLYVTNAKEKSFGSRRIALWDYSNSGYPVEVGVEGSVDSCYDKESLQSQLSLLLQHPKVGSAIDDCIAYKS